MLDVCYTPRAFGIRICLGGRVREDKIDEPVGRILVRFQGGRVEPLEFRWGHREFTVREQNARWVDRETRPIRYFFSVTTVSGEIFQLQYREGDPVWYVDSVLAP